MLDFRAQGVDAASVYTDLQGLGSLKEAARTRSPEALRGVARQFEAVFIGMMLDSMRSATSTIDGGLFDSQESELYQQLFDRQIAQTISNGRGLGIAAAIERQLSRISGQSEPEQPASSSATESSPSQGASRAAGEPVPTPAMTGAQTGFSARTPSDFVSSILPHAQRVAAELGIHPLAIVAQAALETGWGQRVPQRPEGGSSLNFFGIKAGGAWSGAEVASQTMEHVGGALRRQTGRFRAYGSVAEAFGDYARLLRNDPRYRAALSVGSDPHRFAEQIQAGGYATDPGYAEKIHAILKSPTLQRVSRGADTGSGTVTT